MANQSTQRIGNGPKEQTVTKLDTLRDTWRVMKPLVRFSFKALKLLAYALIFIVKHIPKPDEQRPARKNDKVIKI